MKSLEEIKDAIKRITVEENRPLKGNKGPLKQVLEGLLDIVNGLETETSGKQDTLVSGENIKTVNGQSILGEGDLIPNGMVETTWEELKQLRDNAQLVPGTMYRITDYMTTTAQEDTRSVYHQFDVIVTALTESVLSEDAKAIQHRFEIPQSCFVYENENEAFFEGIIIIDGIEYYNYKMEESDEHYAVKPSPDFVGYNEYDDNRFLFHASFYKQDNDHNWEDYVTDVGFTQDIREFSYFSNSNLAAWKLKYCLDNDEDRFAWAKNLYLSPVTHRKCIQLLDTTDNNYPYIYIRQPQLDNESGCAWCCAEENMTIKEYSENSTENIELTNPLYTPSESVYVGQSIDANGNIWIINDFSEQGKGVIYQMVDEYNNNCPYDFYNILIAYPAQEIDSLFESPSHTSKVYIYTFCWINDDNEIDNILMCWKELKNEDYQGISGVTENHISEFIDDTSDDATIKIPMNAIISSYFLQGSYFIGMKSIHFDSESTKNIVIGDCISVQLMGIEQSKITNVMRAIMLGGYQINVSNVYNKILVTGTPIN